MSWNPWDRQNPGDGAGADLGDAVVVVLQSQLPLKIVNLWFTITDPNIKLTISGGVNFLKLINK